MADIYRYKSLFAEIPVAAKQKVKATKMNETLHLIHLTVVIPIGRNLLGDKWYDIFIERDPNETML